jgi:chemotaxis response regulator CheB
VQHLDPHHASQLSNLLGKVTAMPVSEVTGTTTPKPNTVYVQPPNKCVIAKDGTITLVRREERLNVAIDHFFESLAEECGSRAIGIVLSGAGSDGTTGLRANKAAGGLTFAQTLESAKFDAVPRSAIRDWALLRYHPVKAVNIEKAPELGRKWTDVNPRMVGEAAENLKGYE